MYIKIGHDCVQINLSEKAGKAVKVKKKKIKFSPLQALEALRVVRG
jgi:hypothetical protein